MRRSGSRFANLECTGSTHSGAVFPRYHGRCDLVPRRFRALAEPPDLETDPSAEFATTQRSFAPLVAELAAAAAEAAPELHTQDIITQTLHGFLTRLSHELRTPMNGVCGMAALLMKSDLSGEQREYADGVRESADVALGVLEHFLEVTEPTASRANQTVQPFDLLEAVEEVAWLLGPRAYAKGVDFIVRYAPGTPRRVVGDPHRTRMLVRNLASNAVRFTRDGHVLVSVGTAGEGGCPSESHPNGAPSGGRRDPSAVDAAQPAVAELVLEFSDTGIGMDSATLERLVGQDCANSEPACGYGGPELGLSLARRIICQMDGRVTAEARPNIGSKLRVTLSVPLDGDGDPMSERAPPQLTGAKVLVATPARMSRRVLGEQIRSWGATCVCCNTAGAALEALGDAYEAKAPVSVALIDEALPGMSGLRLRQRFLTDEKLAQTAPVLLVSSISDDTQAGGTDGGSPVFVAQIAKPVRPSHLASILASAQITHARRRGTPVATLGTAQEVSSMTRVLVVEDDKLSRRVVKAMLQRLGCSVTLASNGVEAVVIGSQTLFDLVLMDCRMPGMDGFEATANLRALRSAKELPIVALTAYALPADRAQCLAAGMNDYLSKPFKLDELSAIIQRWTRQPGQPDPGDTDAAPRPTKPRD